MQLFEEPLGSLFTDGPAVVVKVEQRKEPIVRSVYDARGMEWREFGVVIYMAKRKAAPVAGPGGHYVMPETAHETRFVRVIDRNGSCEIPANAGRLLGHYREDGVRWWVFLEKLAPEEPARPAPDARQRSGAQSPPAKGAGASRDVGPARPSSQPSSPRTPSPGSTAAPGGR